MDSIYLVFRPVDWWVFGGLFALSVGYAVVLQAWCRRWPESFHDDTWVQAAFGTGYVILALGIVLEREAWLRVCAAFFFASLAIIARSLINRARRRREANQWHEDNDGV